jgi:hypothetical protein
LASITVPQWREWMEWVNIRGPVGGPRDDYYVAFLAQQSAMWKNPKHGEFENFMMPWLRPAETDVSHFIRPWIDTRGTAPNEEKD